MAVWTRIGLVEIANNAKEAARSIRQMNDNIDDVNLAVEETAESASDVLGAANKLRENTNGPQNRVVDFLNSINELQAGKSEF